MTDTTTRSPSRAFSTVEEWEIARRYAAGELGPALAEEFHCCEKTIYRVAHRQGAPRRQGCRPIKNPYRDERVLRDYNRGDSSLRIAVRYGYSSPSNVYGVLNRLERAGREVLWHKKGRS